MPVSEPGKWTRQMQEAGGGPVPQSTPYSGPRDLATGEDGALWFTQTLANGIGRLKLKPGRRRTPKWREFAVPAIDCPSTPERCRIEGINAGPDGSMWFSEFNASRISRIEVFHARD